MPAMAPVFASDASLEARDDQITLRAHHVRDDAEDGDLEVFELVALEDRAADARPSPGRRSLAVHHGRRVLSEETSPRGLVGQGACEHDVERTVPARERSSIGMRLL